MLCSTNTWRAYSSTPFAATDPGTHHHWDSWGRTSTKTLGGPPSYSCYRDHEALQPTYQMGVRMPWPVE